MDTRSSIDFHPPPLVLLRNNPGFSSVFCTHRSVSLGFSIIRLFFSRVTVTPGDQDCRRISNGGQYISSISLSFRGSVSLPILSGISFLLSQGSLPSLVSQVSVCESFFRPPPSSPAICIPKVHQPTSTAPCGRKKSVGMISISARKTLVGSNE